MLPQSRHGFGCPGPIRTRPQERVRDHLAAVAARAREGGTGSAAPTVGGSLGDGVTA
ncbi:hypothetical protein ABZ545_31725 [Streptomyces abikoensis]|uniref:Uncharacterized protein n=1 Tax=Streptomyces abikoensis TaxID=97398 RepID=A0ABW7T7L7_9ACTN